MMQKPIMPVIIRYAVATLNLGYKKPSRLRRRAVLYGKGGKQMREMGLYK